MEVVKEKEEKKGAQALTRPDYKKSVFIGIQGLEENEKLLAVVNEAFPNHHIHIMDKDLFNRNVEMNIRKHIKWQEDQSVLEYTNNSENINQSIQQANNLKEAMGDDWFTLSEMVEKTSFTHKEAKNALDLLFAFGWLAKDEKAKPEKYLAICGPVDQLKYIKGIHRGLGNEMTRVEGIIENLQKAINGEEDTKTAPEPAKPSNGLKGAQKFEYSRNGGPWLPVSFAKKYTDVAIAEYFRQMGDGIEVREMEDVK